MSSDDSAASTVTIDPEAPGTEPGSSSDVDSWGAWQPGKRERARSKRRELRRKAVERARERSEMADRKGGTSAGSVGGRGGGPGGRGGTASGRGGAAGTGKGRGNAASLKPSSSGRAGRENPASGSGGQSDGDRRSRTGDAGGVPSKRALQKLCYEQGRCVKCGSESHRKAQCPVAVTPSPSNKRVDDASFKKPAETAGTSSRDSSANRGTSSRASSASRASSTSKTFAGTAASSASRKRRRDPMASPTGHSPAEKQIKRPASYAAAAGGSTGGSAKKTYTYAKAVEGSLQLVAVTPEELKHIPKSKYLEIQQALSADYIEACKNKRTPPLVEETKHEHAFAWWKLRDEASKRQVQKIVRGLGYECLLMDELLARRRPIFCLLYTSPSPRD